MPPANASMLTKAFQAKPTEVKAIADKPYAYIFKYQSISDVALVAALMKHGIKVRASKKSFSLNGDSFEPGSLIITRRNNEDINDFDKSVQQIAKDLNRKIFTSANRICEQRKRCRR